ncbi:MAG TPA: aminotransferase class V-fold PLP-dependent enzyme [Actinomycetota bacterium]|nr:aminotransferase class V-fold PLP-dependent enzyme [Actinomycetota bacterium]
MEPIDPRHLPTMPDLMIAGPGQMHDEDLGVLGEQLIAHYGDTWVQLHNDTVKAVGRLVNAKDPPYIVPGTGTTCLDAAVMNMFEPGQTVVVARTGFFGERLHEVAEANALEVLDVEVPLGQPADVEELHRIAKKNYAAGILVTHVDTSTGVRHPIQEIARAAHDIGAYVLVDGIASVGGELCDVDGWGIDCLVSSTQKGMESPPGLGIVALGTRGRARVELRSQRPPSWYLDLKRWDWYRENWPWHPHPVTMPSPLVLSLLSSLNRILDVGLEKWVSHRAALAARCREGLSSIGLEPVARPDVQANMIVAAYAEDATNIVPFVLREGIQISGGLAPLAGKTIRVGLMGRTANEQMVDRVVDAIARARKENGA